MQMAITFLNKTSDWLSDEEELWQRERVEDEKGRLRWKVTLKPRAFLETFTHSAVNATVLHTEIDARLSELGNDPHRVIVVHCKSGRRATMAGEQLNAAGFDNLRQLDGHFDGWQAADLPTESSSGS